MGKLIKLSLFTYLENYNGDMIKNENKYIEIDDLRVIYT